MIINREIRTWVDPNSNEKIQQLIVSYVTKEGQINYLTYNIPSSELYEYDYAKRGDIPVDGLLSWDRKPVKRIKTTKKLSNERVYQILNDLNVNGDIDIVFELNTPDTHFWDIENLTSDDGFIEPDVASLPITVMSWVHYPNCVVFGTKPLDGQTIQKIQNNITKHCKHFNNTPKYQFEYRYYSNEYEMLYDFTNNYMAKAACVTGWNIFGYDLMYYFTRCEKLGIDLSVLAPTKDWFEKRLDNGKVLKLPRHKLFYDYLLAYKKWDRTVAVKESNKLDFVGEATCGVKKVQHVLSLNEMWEKTPDDYIYYNAIDSILVEQIDKKIKTSASMYGLSNLTHTEVLEAFSPVSSVHIVQAEYLYKNKKVITKTLPKIEKREYEGAFVFPAPAALSKWVLGLDFASLYPTTQRQFNISPDTFLFNNKGYKPKSNEIKCASGAVFTKDFEGFLPQILTDFYGQRKYHKKLMKNAYQSRVDIENEIAQGKRILDEATKALIENYKLTEALENDLQMAVKLFINSVYGATGSQYYNFYNPNIAESITLQGQDLIKFSLHVIEDYVYNIWHTDINSHNALANVMKEKYADFDMDKFMNLARNQIMRGKNLAVGGDTDSIYITFDCFVNGCQIPEEQAAYFIVQMNEIILKKYLNSKFEEYAATYNCDKNLEEFELEKLARTVIYLAKKHYVMDLAWKEPNVFIDPLQKIIYAGIEVVQGSTPPWCRDEQKKFIKWFLEFYMRGKSPEYSEIVAKLKEIKNRYALQNPEVICKSMNISDYEKYILDDKQRVVVNEAARAPQHVLAAARYNNMLYTTAKRYLTKYPTIKKGDKIKLYYISKDEVFGYMPYQYPIEFAPPMDVDTNFEKIMLAPLNRIIMAAGYNPVNAGLTFSNALW